MRCLLLSPFVPFPPEDGGRIRIYELLRGLSRRNTVDVLTLSDATPESNVAVEQLRREGFEVEAVPHGPRTSAALVQSLRAGRSLYGTRFASTAFAEALDTRLAKHDYDVVQCEFAYTAQYAPTGRSRAGPRWVLDAHNVEFRLNETLAQSTRGLKGLTYRVYAQRERRLRRAEELEACLRVDRVVTVSNVDRDVLRFELPDLDAEVVPNGVDLERFTPSRRAEQDRAQGAVFIGKMDYRPNVDAVEWFCSEILPLVRRKRPGFTFTICGAPATRAVVALGRLPGVRVAGRVADTRPSLDEAAVVVVPLRAGSGTRLKILEALAMARPVVATTLAAEGLEVDDGVHLLIADAPDAFAERVVRLAEDVAERRRLGRAGRSLVEQRYGWETAVALLEEVYADLLAEQGAGVPR
jgi:sugar transferase (PEP-CTERM/EpsH1 system associated)